MSEGDILDVSLAVARACEGCGVAYFLGGSLASSYQGEPRATNDIDFVIDLREADVDPLVAALGAAFDVDTDALRNAARERRSWNIVYLPTVTKIDLFIKGREPFDSSEFARRHRVEIAEGRLLFMKSPEDTILRKLLWYRDGGGVSDRQWRDIVGVLRHSAPTLDKGYLGQWAQTLGLTEMLARACQQAGRP